MNISSKQKKWLIIVLSILVVIISGAFAFYMIKRDYYLQQMVTKVQGKLKSEYNLNFTVNKYGFKGLSTVVFEDVDIVPTDRDTLASLNKFGVAVRVFPLLFGEVKIADLAVNQGKVSFVKKDSISNYDFLFQRKDKDSVKIEQPNERNFAEWAEKIAKQVFSIVPQNMSLREFEVSYTDSLMQQRVRVPEAIIDDGDFETSLFLNDHDAEWLLKGYVDGDDQRLKVEVSSKEKETELPFLRGKYGLGISFDKLFFDLTGIKKKKKDLLHIDGSFGYENLVINHRRLSDQSILLPEGKAKGGLAISNDFVSLQEGSKFTVKDFSIEPMLKYSLRPEKKLDLSIHTGRFEAQHFFDAMPKGLFESLDGIEVSGGVVYDLDFSVVFNKPDKLIFSSKIDDDDLKIIKWGNANIDSLNGDFEYDAYNDTVLVKKILVGSSNPNFVSFSKIPNVLITTVRNTEDPFFYKHNGFEEEAFKLSIATNIKEKKFKRGASTISMQLVKNVFLNRKKTMTRKFEEILLVWLMERSGRVSKDRMLEIYLNVIEWGKNVYGISEAAKYYFEKDVSQIGLGESLFLSSIIPRPKTGLSSFDYTGQLKPWVQKHFNTYGYIMTKVGDLKNVAVPENYGFYDVVLKPSLRPSAPLVSDSTMFNIDDEHELFMRSMDEIEEERRMLFDKKNNNE